MVKVMPQPILVGRQAQVETEVVMDVFAVPRFLAIDRARQQRKLKYRNSPIVTHDEKAV